MSRARSRVAVETKVSSQRLYEVIRAPVVTEKSTLASEVERALDELERSYEGNEPEIKTAVEDLFKVKVKAINTLRQKGKTKRFRGRPGKRNDMKKAYVTLEEGHSIDVTTGI